MSYANESAVAIIGAGPYGLSIAAHLRSAGVDYRIFGKPMQTWRAHMPKGMFLKSEWDASDLYTPSPGGSLKEFCAEEKIPCTENKAPISLETFTQYGLAFQRRFVPDVEDVMVTGLDRRSSRFELQLANGERLQAGKVIVATGVAHAAHVPAELANLPGELLAHSNFHDDLSELQGRNVTVIGAGQSALETAALLHESGADVLLLARRSALVWNDPPFLGRRSLYQRLRRPSSGLGPGLGPWFYCNAPHLFRRLPERIRIARTKKTLGPAGGWWLKERVLDRLPIMLGHSVQGAETCGGKAVLHLQSSAGERRQITTDFVIAATGYRFVLAAERYLSPNLLAQLRSVQETPVLSAHFESTVPGLYFTGLATANQFGPSMRFLYGAGFTARRISRHISASGRRFRWLMGGWGSAAPKCEESEMRQ